MRNAKAGSVDFVFALGMCRVRRSPACRTERKRSPEQPGPKGNAQTLILEARPFRQNSCSAFEAIADQQRGLHQQSELATPAAGILEPSRLDKLSQHSHETAIPCEYAQPILLGLLMSCRRRVKSHSATYDAAELDSSGSDLSECCRCQNANRRSALPR